MMLWRLTCVSVCVSTSKPNMMLLRRPRMRRGSCAQQGLGLTGLLKDQSTSCKTRGAELSSWSVGRCSNAGVGLTAYDIPQLQ